LIKHEVSVGVPGKLFVAGEYAVTRPGSWAMVAAIKTDFTVTVTETSGLSALTTNVDLPDFSFSLQQLTVPADSEWAFALSALCEMNLFAKQEIAIHIESRLGFGANKKGYGSSASVVVGVIDAVNAFFELGLSENRRFKMAANAHQKVQGSGSMGDVAAITAGGVILYQSPGAQIIPLNFPWKNIYVVRTGAAVKTGEKLALSLPDDFYQMSDEIVLRLAKTKNFEEFKRDLDANQFLLLTNLPEGYMTDDLELAMSTIRGYDKLAAKISGSGFGENIIVFDHGAGKTVLQEVKLKLELAGMIFEKVELAETKYE
jgi:phosphomevalonate kinase